MGIVDAIKEIASDREGEDNWDSARKQRNYMAHDYPDKEYIWATDEAFECHHYRGAG